MADAVRPVPTPTRSGAADAMATRPAFAGSRPDPAAGRVGRRDGGPEPIAVMIGQLTQGGSERQLFLFLARCDRTRWAPTVYVSGELGPWAERIRALAIPVVLLTGGRLAKARQLRAACRAQGAALFFSWSSYTNAYGLALIGGGVRRIGSFRNAGFSDLPERARLAWTWASTAAVSLAVCNSRETCEQLERRRVWRPRSVFVPNGVEVPTPDQIRAWRGTWRRRLGLDENTVLVAGVGRLVPQKRFDRFVAAMALVAAHRPARAVIAGRDFGCGDGLAREIMRRGLDGAVHLLGPVPDARELIAAADILLLSSDHEGMPNVVLEAMAAGVPCVATDVNAVADLIAHGETGFIAPREAGALARHVVELARDAALRRRIGAAARAAVLRRQSADASARRLWALCAREDR